MEEFMLKPPVGAAKKKKVRGRGYSSGKGARCGRGNKGQNARSGGGVRVGFEGGQMPLYRRIARRGFTNAPFKRENTIINLGAINRKFEENEIVSKETLISKRLLKKSAAPVKILGAGKLEKKLIFKVENISAGAQKKIEVAGGTIELQGEKENR
ncbi:MAG: 50S ribosomal protein L15 [Spirochaetes bacterium]|nr:MAG: 50S ribosomal protein L15 [Spirochaetota bacterium]